MRVVLAHVSESTHPRKIWLRAGQTLSVGRTEQADVVIDDDGTMSGVHFQVGCEADACQIVDLNSSNGTFLNETKISTANLQDGDQIRAGKTIFAVSIEESSTGVTASETAPKVTAPVHDSLVADITTIEKPTTADYTVRPATGELPYREALDDADVNVRTSALVAAAWSGERWVIDACRKLAEQPTAELLPILQLFAVLAGPEDFATIASCANVEALGPARMQLLGAYGHPRVIDILLDAIESDELPLALAAARAFTKMTGADIASDEQVLVPPADAADSDEFDEEFADEVMRPSAKLARAHWDSVRQDVGDAVRLCCGLDLSAGIEPEVLMWLDLESRSEACLRDCFQGSHRWSLVDLMRFPQAGATANTLVSESSSNQT